jgi:hypothetical protein
MSFKYVSSPRGGKLYLAQNMTWKSIEREPLLIKRSGPDPNPPLLLG